MTRFERLFVWSGGALFVTSLATCVYYYAVAWARPATDRFHGGTAAATVVNAALFSVFALHRGLFAGGPVKRRVARVVPDRFVRSCYVWTASVLLFAVLVLWRPIGGVLYDVGGWRAFAHAAVQLSGVWLIARSVAR